MKKLFALALVFFAFAFSANAIDLPPGKWWRRPEVIQLLNLTDDQQTRLETVSVKAANELIDLKAEVDKANVALRAELDQGSLNRDAIRKAAIRLNDTRGRLFERELMMLVDMRAVLTETQWNQMRRTLDRFEQRQMQQQQKNPMRPNMRQRRQ